MRKNDKKILLSDNLLMISIIKCAVKTVLIEMVCL